MKARILQFFIIVCCIISACKKPSDQIQTKSGSISKNLGTTYYQSAPSYNSAFQALINQAQPGDVIVLRSGSHYVTNPITIPVGKNGITIIGEDGAVIRKASSANVVGILIWSDYNTIHHLEIDGGELPESGIMVYGGHNNLTDLRIHNCRNAGILLHMGAGPACVMNKIEGCHIYWNGNVGISQSGHCDGRIAWCTIYENGYEGITIDNGSHNNVIHQNGILRNNTKCAVGGIGIDGSNGNDITDNDIIGNYCRSGITFQNNVGGCDGTIVTGNTITGNAQYGILERWTQYANTNSLFANNDLTGNAWGPHHIIY